MSDYKLVCGLETHVELATKTKIFCNCTTAFGGAPNTHCCPVCTGQPGAIPVLNQQAVKYAVRAGLALHCKINNHSHMDRKNYTYPDLPKAYQISQFDEPVCEGGYIELDSGKRIGITRIHIEEDAGKLVHEGTVTYVDYNRGGVPLIEIVSEPDIETAEEAKEYAEKLQLIMRAIGVSDCKMQEGSMRCDCNVSIHKEGTPFGTRTEIKNVSSLSNIEKAIKAEMIRQEDMIDSGESVRQATMRYDADADITYIMRLKENSDDYRYFPEPDILRFYIPEAFVEEEQGHIPELPVEKKRRYVEELGLSEEVVSQLYKYKRVTDFFDGVVGSGATAKNTANLIIKALYSCMATEEDKENFEISVSVEEMSKLVKFVDEKKLNFNTAAETLAKMNESGKPVSEFVKAEDVAGLSEEDLVRICREAVEANPKAVEDIRSGKDKAINVMFGYVMKNTRGKADVSVAAKIIKDIIFDK